MAAGTLCSPGHVSRLTVPPAHAPVDSSTSDARLTTMQAWLRRLDAGDTLDAEADAAVALATAALKGPQTAYPMVQTSLVVVNRLLAGPMGGQVAHSTHAATLWRAALGRLGDTKERVRSESLVLLVHLTQRNDFVSASEKDLKGAFTLKSPLVREQTLRWLQLSAEREYLDITTAVKEYGALAIKLVDDAAAPVRDQAKETLTGLYQHSSEAARMYMRRQLATTKGGANLLVQLQGPSTVSVATEDCEGLMSRTSSAGSLSSPPITSMMSLGTGPLLTLDPDESLPAIKIYSDNDVFSATEKVTAALIDKETEENWQQRDRALDLLRSLVRLAYRQREYSNIVLNGVRETLPGIVQSMLSLRTQINLKACKLGEDLVICFRTSLETTMQEQLTMSALKLCQQARKIVIPTAARFLEAAVVCIPTSRLANHFLGGLADKNKDYRAVVANLLFVFIQHCPPAVLSKTGPDAVSKALKGALGDAIPSVREAARLSVWAVRKTLPAVGDQLLSSLDPQTQKLVRQSENIYKKHTGFIYRESDPQTPSPPPTRASFATAGPAKSSVAVSPPVLAYSSGSPAAKPTVRAASMDLSTQRPATPEMPEERAVTTPANVPKPQVGPIALETGSNDNIDIDWSIPELAAPGSTNTSAHSLLDETASGLTTFQSNFTRSPHPSRTVRELEPVRRSSDLFLGAILSPSPLLTEQISPDLDVSLSGPTSTTTDSGTTSLDVTLTSTNPTTMSPEKHLFYPAAQETTNQPEFPNKDVDVVINAGTTGASHTLIDTDESVTRATDAADIVAQTEPVEPSALKEPSPVKRTEGHSEAEVMPHTLLRNAAPCDNDETCVTDVETMVPTTEPAECEQFVSYPAAAGDEVSSPRHSASEEAQATTETALQQTANGQTEADKTRSLQSPCDESITHLENEIYPILNGARHVSSTSDSMSSTGVSRPVVSATFLMNHYQELGHVSTPLSNGISATPTQLWNPNKALSGLVQDLHQKRSVSSDSLRRWRRLLHAQTRDQLIEAHMRRELPSLLDLLYDVIEHSLDEPPVANALAVASECACTCTTLFNSPNIMLMVQAATRLRNHQSLQIAFEAHRFLQAVFHRPDALECLFSRALDFPETAEYWPLILQHVQLETMPVNWRDSLNSQLETCWASSDPARRKAVIDCLVALVSRQEDSSTLHTLSLLPFVNAIHRRLISAYLGQ